MKNNQTIILRRYQADDLHQIINLFRETVHTINKRDYTPNQLKAWAPESLDINTWSDSLEKHITYVALLNDQIVGFADMSNEGYFDRLYVHKDHQGQHIAKRLIKAI